MNTNKDQVPQCDKTAVSGSFFDKTFRKIPIIIYKDFDCDFNKNMWYCEVADDYANYKPKKYSEINFEDLDYHFEYRKNELIGQGFGYFFRTRRDAVLAAKEVILNTNFNFKIWFL